MKRLQLRYWGGETAEVLCMESVGLNQFEGAIGTVTRNQAGLWSARASEVSTVATVWSILYLFRQQ